MKGKILSLILNLQITIYVYPLLSFLFYLGNFISKLNFLYYFQSLKFVTNKICMSVVKIYSEMFFWRSLSPKIILLSFSAVTINERVSLSTDILIKKLHILETCSLEHYMMTNLNYQLYITNLLIIVAKYHFHKSNCISKKINFLVFMKVKQCIDSIRFSSHTTI